MRGSGGGAVNRERPARVDLSRRLGFRRGSTPGAGLVRWLCSRGARARQSGAYEHVRESNDDFQARARTSEARTGSRCRIERQRTQWLARGRRVRLLAAGALAGAMAQGAARRRACGRQRQHLQGCAQPSPTRQSAAGELRARAAGPHKGDESGTRRLLPKVTPFFFHGRLTRSSSGRGQHRNDSGSLHSHSGLLTTFLAQLGGV
jgi:hypothetical protein